IYQNLDALRITSDGNSVSNDIRWLPAGLLKHLQEIDNKRRAIPRGGRAPNEHLLPLERGKNLDELSLLAIAQSTTDILRLQSSDFLVGFRQLLLNAINIRFVTRICCVCVCLSFSIGIVFGDSRKLILPVSVLEGQNFGPNEQRQKGDTGDL